tara:strand:+ start:213 stop:458 length:246 start_codon:yes stop_codon:yes gene_type:complete
MTKIYYTTTDRILEEDFGIANTRVIELRMAMEQVHRAICKLDNHNLIRIWEHYPELVSVADRYGRNENGLKTFTQEELTND